MPICKMCEENYPMISDDCIDWEQQYSYCSEGCWVDSSEYAEIEDQIDDILISFTDDQLNNLKSIISIGDDAIKLLIERIELENRYD